MAGMSGFFRRLWLLLRRDRFRNDLDEEMAFHRAQQQGEFEAAGMSPRQARQAASRQFGNGAKLRQQSHEIVGFRLESVWQDLRYTARQLLRMPGFTFAAIATLALGIGANTAIFSLVHATLLRQLPFPGADRILSIEDQRVNGSSSGGMVAVPRFFDLKARNRSFDSIAFYYYENPTLVAGTQLPERMDGVGATGQFWRVFGAQPMLGRTFDERDDRPKAPEVAVLSYSAWQRLFGGRADAINSIITIDKLPTTIIGVMPPEFDYPSGTAVWRPTHFGVAEWTQYRGDGVRFARVFARLKPEASISAAQNELRVIGNQLQAEHAESDAPWQFLSMSLREYQYGALRPALLILLAASTVLLLIACINVSNFLLSRATTRQREVALRQALGASRARLLQQYVTESLLLTLAGGAAGLASAFALVHFAETRLPGALRTVSTFALDWPVVWFALGVATLAGIIFGLVPAFGGRDSDLSGALKRGETRVGATAGARFRDGFIAVQVCLSLVLLVAASLLVQSLWKLTKTPLGFQPDHLLAFQIKLPWGANAAATNRFYDETQHRMEQLPGVSAVGQISSLPTEGYNYQASYDGDWLPRTPHQDALRAEAREISGDYIKAMGIPLFAGRALRERDKAVLVNQEFVRQFLKDQSPLGHYLLFDKTSSVEIAGVLGNVRGTTGSIAEKIQPEIYFAADGIAARSFVLRTQMPAEQLPSLIHAVREQVHQVDPQQAVGDPRTLDDMLNKAVAQPRLNMALLVAFAGITLLLACVGIYGVVAYSVAQRRQEIGVRMALGASRSQISLLFLRRTFTPALIGLTAGTGLTLLVTRLLRSQLYGVEPNNPTTFLIAVLLLLMPVLVASLRPALKAASVDPVEALRTE